jgi:hypothetical protein
MEELAGYLEQVVQCRCGMRGGGELRTGQGTDHCLNPNNKARANKRKGKYKPVR